MRTFGIILCCVCILTACSTEDTKKESLANNKPTLDKNENTTDAPVPEQSSSLIIGEEFCDCVEDNDPSECYEEFKSKGHDALSLAQNECYIDAKLAKHADDLCNCINSIKQVSLRCDEVQKEIDKHCDKFEQQALQTYFDGLNCIE